MSWLALVRHVMRVDARAQRWALAAWGLVLLAQAVVFAADPERIAAYQARSNYDFGIQVVRLGWTVIMAALFVQSDLLVGTTAFWMTRPIPRPVLLTAKLVSLSAWLVVVPSAVMAAVLFYLGMRPIDALTGGGLIGLEQAVVLAMAVMAALVTANIGQFIVAGIAGVTLVVVFNHLLLPVLTLTWPAVGDTLRGGRPTIYAAVVIVGGLAVTAHHYFTLRIWRTAVLIAAAMFLATGLTRLWPAQAAERAYGPAPESLVSSGAVTLRAVSSMPRTESVTKRSAGRWDKFTTLEIVTATEGHQPNIYFWPLVSKTTVSSAARPSFQWSGPTTLIPVDRRSRPSTLPADQGSSEGEDGQPWRSIQIALGDVDLDAARRPRVYFTPVAEIPEVEFSAVAAAPAQLKSDITMVAYRYEVVAAVPLTSGVSFNSAGRAGRIVSVTGVNAGLQIELHETFLRGQPPLAQGDFGTRWYALRNKAKRQAVLLEWKGRDSFAATIGIAATSVMRTRGTLGMETAQFSSPRTLMDAEWLAGAELVVVEPRPLGVMTRTLTIENLVLGAGAVR